MKVVSSHTWGPSPRAQSQQRRYLESSPECFPQGQQILSHRDAATAAALVATA